MEEIRFLKTRKKYGCFSNFYRHPVFLKGKEWPTSEHYYQAQKVAGTPFEEMIREAPSAYEAAQMGRDPAMPLRPDWDRIKDDVMKEVVMAKFSHNPQLRDILLSTGTATIIEASPYDSYWGEGSDRQGLNRLGLILMEVREELRAY